MPSITDPQLGGDLKTVSGEWELAEFEAHLDDNVDSGSLGTIRGACRTLARSIVENSGPSPERVNALNDLRRVYENAKIAALR